ncbi:MAG: hypothetical protein K2I10_14265 [Lachnospiraceae bacterium]|nr:hypothetical protein [Lachnospiraceae bacterium]
MNKLDKEIRKMAKQCKAPENAGYEARIDHLLEGINGTQANSEGKKVSMFYPSKAGFAACVLGVALLIGVPVAAKVNSVVTQRMQEMSRKEQKKIEEANDYNKMTREHDTEGLAFSRKLSGEETRRFGDLWDKYEEEGLFPDGELKIVDKLEGDEEISSLVYETWNREIFLPESELTDEEMLQIIDFEHKSAYVVENSEESKKARAAQDEFNENPNPGENDLSKDEAVAKASAYLKAMYDVDADGMDKSAEFGIGFCSTLDNGQYGEWDVEFKGSDGWSYVVAVSRQTGKIAEIHLYKEEVFVGSYGGNPAPINEKIYTPVYEKAKGILNSMYPDIEITDGSVGYGKGKDGYTDDRFLQIDFFTKDGYHYIFQYVLDDEVFSYLMVHEGGNYDGWEDSLLDSFNVIKIE